MTTWILLERCIWAAGAALGFATLFTVPIRAFWAVALLAVVGYALRGMGMMYGLNLVLATLIASCTMGILAIQIAHWVHTPTTVFMAPAVIPMVPGVFAYRTMMGLLEISSTGSAPVELLSSTANSGLIAAFTLLSLAVGVSLPSLLFKNKSVKEIRFFKASRD